MVIRLLLDCFARAFIHKRNKMTSDHNVNAGQSDETETSLRKLSGQKALRDPVLDLIVYEMRRRHGCDNLILYGSRAMGTQTSAVMIVCYFCSRTKVPAHGYEYDQNRQPELCQEI